MVNYDIANNSWGFKKDFALGNVPEGKVDTALALAFSTTLAATNGRGGLGTIVVASGGNQRDKGGSAQGSLTNNNRHAIEVAAINAKADLSVLQAATAPFSNPGSSLLVAAPGSHVLSTGVSLEAERGASVGSAYSTTQGTSFAAPIVSGVVALMLQANPGSVIGTSSRSSHCLRARWMTHPPNGPTTQGATGTAVACTPVTTTVLVWSTPVRLCVLPSHGVARRPRPMNGC